MTFLAFASAWIACLGGFLALAELAPMIED